MQTIRITTSQNIDIDYELGGLGERIVARIIDLGIFVLILFGSLTLLTSLKIAEFTVGILTIIYLVLFVFYDLICEITMNGQSIGKKVMKIKVISLDGAQPRLGQYLLRWLFRIVDFLIGGGVIALVVAASSEKCQRVGDLVAGTALVKTVPRANFQQVSFKATDDGYEPVFAGAAQLNDRDIELINEVVNSYIKTGSSVLVYNMALRIKEHLGVTPPAEMNDMRFLQVILKDYSHIVAQTESL